CATTPDAASDRPSALNDRWRTSALRPHKVARSDPVWASQTLTEPSSAPETTADPSGLKATERTRARCPSWSTGAPAGPGAQGSSGSSATKAGGADAGRWGSEVEVAPPMQAVELAAARRSKSAWRPEGTAGPGRSV